MNGTSFCSPRVAAAVIFPAATSTRGWSLRVLRTCARLLPVLTLSVLLGTQPCRAQDDPEREPFHNGLALQGFTGILNTPSAHVAGEGELYGMYSNQQESRWRSSAQYQDNYMFSLGFFSFAEAGARLTARPGANSRDLSGSFKLSSAPFTREKPWLPVLAFGVQDLTGGSTLLSTKYAVLSQDLWRLRFSAGYGTGPDRMKGLFGGAELKAHDWVYLLCDYDTRETNLGVRVVTPELPFIPVRLTATAKTSLDYRPGNFDIAVGFSVPLDFRVRGRQTGNSAVPRLAAPTPDEAAGQVADQPAGQTAAEPPRQAPMVAPESASAAGTPQDATALKRLHHALVSAGMVNVRVGTRGHTLVVAYENTVFNHNELDALGLVAGLACRASAGPLDTLEVVVKRRNLPVLRFAAALEDLRGFLDGAPAALDRFRVELPGAAEPEAEFLAADPNSGALDTSLVLAPGLTTFIGTEYSPFDYLLSLKPELTTQLWTGAQLHARWDIPLSWSENLDDGKPYRSSRNTSQMERLMLYQALKPWPAVTVNLGGGMVVHDRYGMLNEALWSPGEGEHRFRISQGWTQDGDTRRRSQLLLGSYRYYFAPLDLSLEGTAGRFWSEDEGFALELKRFWEDTAVSVYYKNSKGTDDKRWQAVGLQFSFPLTPRRDMKPRLKLQVRGSDEWSYAQETTLKNNNVNSLRGNLNYLAPYPLAINPQPAPSAARSLYNRDRLSPAYVRQHLGRLREAWQKFGSELP